MLDVRILDGLVKECVSLELQSRVSSSRETPDSGFELGHIALDASCILVRGCPIREDSVPPVERAVRRFMKHEHVGQYDQSVEERRSHSMVEDRTGPVLS